MEGIYFLRIGRVWGKLPVMRSEAFTCIEKRLAGEERLPETWKVGDW